ncbi:MAG: aspartate 1-decarboxylase [Alphaproteobacteria bacterium]|nr:aspartate 1-decarboxylase [Alphaproteobacteria bacterium]
MTDISTTSSSAISSSTDVSSLPEPILTLMKGKIHRATVTHAELEYEGSIGIDANLLKEAGILPYERVEIYDITNGQRFATYAIEAPAGSGVIAIYGAAAHLCKVGDKVIICAYVQMVEQRAKNHKPNVVLLGEGNAVKSTSRVVECEVSW